eukprot:COSAG06_NODE_1237_length_10134_cov_17.263777_1_plen_1586_part_10
MGSTRHDAGCRRAVAVVWWLLAASCSSEDQTTIRRSAAAAAKVSTTPGLAASGGADDSGRRRAQGVDDHPLCAEFERTLLCSTAARREMCPSTCAAAAVPTATPPAAAGHLSCEQVMDGGGCGLFAEACPEICATSGDGSAVPVAGASTRADGAAVFQTSCLVLLKLEGGCAHDLSVEDAALAHGTRVSDVCPDDCSGHGKCAASAVDISFMDSIDDSSGFGATVELHGGACVDGGGASFDGGTSWAAIVPGLDYGNGAGFAISFWMVPAAEDVWEPHKEFAYSRVLFDHPPRSQSSVAGGISLAMSRRAWLDSWTMRVSMAGTDADYELDLLRDAAPKWTHLVIKVEATHLQVYEDGEQIHDTVGRAAAPRKYAGTMDLASELTVGGSDATYGWPPTRYNFRGSIAMLQLYAATASAELDIQCAFNGGKGLVQNQRMAQDTRSECRDRIRTGCTNQNADNFDQTLPADAIDDGSCQFTQHEAAAGEHGRVIHVTDDWQRVDLTGSYSNPVVLCGVVTRDSTTEAVVRVRSIATDPRTGMWYFEIAAEQKTCHSAEPPPTSEHVDFIVVEAGVSTEGWQAGLTRVHDADWHRVSLLQETTTGVQPVVVSQVQTYDNRTRFVSTRHYLPHGSNAQSNFVGVDMEMEWPDARDYCRAHYHDLASIHSQEENSQVLAQCDTTRTHPKSNIAKQCYIGANDRETEGIWQWADGSTWDEFVPPWATVAGSLDPNDSQAHSDENGNPGQDWGAIDSALTGDQYNWGLDDAAGMWQDTGIGGFDYLIGFVCERNLPENATATLQQLQRHLGFFLKLQGGGIWCQDGEFFAEYFDNLDLSGTPHATQCEKDVPHWRWHSTSLADDRVPGVPPILMGKTRTLAPELFSARWTARLSIDPSDEYVFSSHANRGSRMIVDDATILDYWEECCSTFSSEPLWLSAGAHVLVYEYRSGDTTDYSPTDSYAELSWSAGGVTVGAVSGSNSTNVTSTAEELYADVGWLACDAGHGTLHAHSFQSGLVVADASLATTLHFGSAFSVSPPRIFAGIVSDADLSSHLRLTAAATEQAAVAIEYDTCEAVFDSAATMVGWIALAAPDGDSVRVAERQTLQTDSAALLSIGDALQLPDYYHWRNSSDPCIDRWTGIECRRDASGTPRIVVLDIHNVDLTNQDIPWQFIGQLTALEEIALINPQVTGTIDSEYVCRLTSLQALILRQNRLRGTVPECMASLPLQTLWLDDNKLHGPLLELSALGQFLKSLPGASLRHNRWAPLLASEKAALEEVSDPLGVLKHPHGKDWDFAYSYEWEQASGVPEDRLTAAREVSYRQWSGGVPFAGYYVELDFEFPVRGNTVATIGVGRDGDIAATDRKFVYFDRDGSASGWPRGGPGAYMGCFVDVGEATDAGDRRFESQISWFDLGNNIGAGRNRMDIPSHEECATRCGVAGYSYMGLANVDRCSCGNEYGRLPPTTTTRCGDSGAYCGNGPNTGHNCYDRFAVFAITAWQLPDGASDASTSSDSSCWSSLPALVPTPHTISEEASDRSSQGEAYFTERFCPGWSTFILPSCDPDAEECGGETAGNAVFDGGGDMYDIGNLITT